ncbi:MAG: segregation/condensation protein A [Oscillospiraceae bacterium]|nr:segregation/condensation protein A [Oscillospiraceae bacterium]
MSENINSIEAVNIAENNFNTENKFLYHTDVFDGPLDLLLTLIAKNKIDICDIVITELIDQYMEQINIMQQEEMDIASEFLQMASRLVYIKSVMLLPKYEEEAEQLQKELTGQLIEYKLCKEIATKLAPMVCFDYFTKAPGKMNFDTTYDRSHNPIDIAKAFVSAVGRGKAKLPPPKEAFSGIVSKKIVSVSSKIITVMRKLYRGNTVKYRTLFEAADGKSDLVATFLAVLELVKGKRVRIDGDGENAEVRMIE